MTAAALATVPPPTSHARWRAVVVGALLLLLVAVGIAPSARSGAVPAAPVLWPAVGIAVLALCLALPSWRPTVLTGVAVATLAAHLAGEQAIDVSIACAAADVVEVTVTVSVLTRGRAMPSLAGLQDLLRLVLAAVAGALLGAVVAAVAMVAIGETESLETARSMFAGDLAAVLVLAPLGMVVPGAQRTHAREIERALQWGALTLVALLVFIPQRHLPLTFLPFPVLAWGALRLPARAVTAQLAGYALLVHVFSAAGRGPFAAELLEAGHAPEVVSTLLSAYLVATALVSLPLSVMRADQLSALEELGRSHALVTNILESTTGTAILGTDLDGCIEFFNVGAERLTGYRAEEVTGDRVAALRAWDDGTQPRELVIDLDVADRPDRLEPLVRPFRDSDGHLTQDWGLRRRDGELRTVSVTLSRRLGENGRPVGYLAAAEDVTDRRRQEALLGAALEKERQVVERLAQIDQTKNDFLASVSHELRTPITSIVGYAELLLSDPGGLPTMHHQIIGRIDRNGRRLMGLIEDMLTMSQVEDGNFRFDKGPLDLREPVHAAVEGIQPSLAIHDLRLEVELGDDPITVFGDRDKLERVVTNLLTNAAKFSHGGELVQVRLSTEGDQAVLAVTDSGVGISAEDQAHLFDRFFRGADAYARAIQGVGLGLPIASSIVAGHDGRIDVVSELDRGSTFIVRLPLLGADKP